MISAEMTRLAHSNSAIRAMFEEGNRLASIYGRDKVYDFSLGNPNFPAPAQVKDAILDVLNEEESTFVHGYMPNSGYPDVCQAIADSLNRRFGTDFTGGNILMTVGAAGGLNVILKTLLNPGDQVLVFAPYFLEYGNYVRNYGGELSVVPPNLPTFQPNLEKFEQMLTPDTKAVIINTPNNPTGVIYSEQTLEKLGEILERKQAEFGTSIYVLSDEPYYVQWKVPIFNVLEACGQRIFFTHGHRNSLYLGTGEIISAAKKSNCKIALYGHTHIAAEKLGEVFTINPGSCFRPRGGQKPSFAMLNLTKNIGFECIFYELSSLGSKPFFPARTF